MTGTGSSAPVATTASTPPSVPKPTSPSIAGAAPKPTSGALSIDQATLEKGADDQPSYVTLAGHDASGAVAKFRYLFADAADAEAAAKLAGEPGVHWNSPAQGPTLSADVPVASVKATTDDRSASAPSPADKLELAGHDAGSLTTSISAWSPVQQERGMPSRYVLTFACASAATADGLARMASDLGPKANPAESRLALASGPGGSTLTITLTLPAHPDRCNPALPGCAK